MKQEMLDKKSVSVKTKSATLVKETFPVLEMTCAACAVSVESMLKSVAGVKDAGVNFANQDAWVEYDPAVATPAMLQNTVRSIGYDLVIEKENQQEVKEAAQEKQYQAIRQRTIWSSILSVPIVVIGMFFMDMPYANWIMLILATPVVGYFGRSFFVNAYKQATHGKANMDTLVALSTGIAYLFSAFNTFYPSFWHNRGLHPHVYYEAAAVIIAFISLGKLLEEKAKSNTSSAIKKSITFLVSGSSLRKFWAIPFKSMCKIFQPKSVCSSTLKCLFKLGTIDSESIASEGSTSNILSNPGL